MQPENKLPEWFNLSIQQPILPQSCDQLNQIAANDSEIVRDLESESVK